MAQNRSLAELRTTQDWQLRFAVAKAGGVAEVASVGGFVKQYSVVIDPRRLRAFDISLEQMRAAIRGSNMDVGGRVVELNAVEGKRFPKGAILAKLEDVAYQAQVLEAEAAVASAQRKLESAKMRLAVMLPESVRKVEIAQAENELKEAEAQRARAKDLLESSNHPVDAVAELSGFGSPAILRHHFRQQMATTPKAYRATFGTQEAMGAA